MVKVRQDAWSHEDDLLLAETVLRHIREGSTQLNAFEEVGDKLNRTSAACGFRWNAEVRQRYDQAVDIAKRQRKEKKRQLTSQQKQSSNSFVSNWEKGDMEEESSISINQFTDYEFTDEITNVASKDINSIDLDSVIRYLKSLKKDVDTSFRSKQTAEKLRQEKDTLTAENQKLQKEIKKLEKQLETVQVDYQAFLQIMDRARKMVVFHDQDESTSPAFRMEKNGNLEQVAK